MFGIETGKSLGSLLAERVMETNPERCMSVLSGFAPFRGGGDLPYQECKEAFIRLKEYLANPPPLSKPHPNTSFTLYLEGDRSGYQFSPSAETGPVSKTHTHSGQSTPRT